MDWLPRAARRRRLAAGQRHVVMVITRADCHLCEAAVTRLRQLAPEWGFDLRLVDVDADPALRDQFSDRVPVIMLDGAEHGFWRLEEDRLRAALRR